MGGESGINQVYQTHVEIQPKDVDYIVALLSDFDIAKKEWIINNITLDDLDIYLPEAKKKHWLRQQQLYRYGWQEPIVPETDEEYLKRARAALLRYTGKKEDVNG